MNVSNLNYPLICFAQDDVFIQNSESDLTSCNKLAIKKGFYKDQLLVDSSGIGLEIANAKKLHGIGFLWGYNIFLEQRVRVELIPDGDPFKLSLDEVRAKVLKVFRDNRSFWASGGNFEEIEQAILNAKTIPEIIDSIPA